MGWFFNCDPGQVEIIAKWGTDQLYLQTKGGKGFFLIIFQQMRFSKSVWHLKNGMTFIEGKTQDARNGSNVVILISVTLCDILAW